MAISEVKVFGLPALRAEMGDQPERSSGDNESSSRLMPSGRGITGLRLTDKKSQSQALAQRDLVPLCIAGDAEAQENFVRQMRPIVERSVRATLASRGLSRESRVEDITHDIFLSLFQAGCRRLRQFSGRNGCSLGGWLRVVAVRATIDFLRKDYRERAIGKASNLPQELLDCIAADGGEPERMAAAREALGVVRRALVRLPQEDQLLAELYFARGLPMGKIATLMSTTANALYIRKGRMVQRLRQALRLKNGNLPWEI